MAKLDGQFNIKNIYLGLGASLFVLVLSFSGFLDNFEAQTLDYRFLLRGGQGIDSAIKIIEIDDESIKQFGRWPWPRGYFAGFMRILSSYKPKVIGFDILFSEEDLEHPEYDELMVGETQRLGNVYYAMYLSGDQRVLKFSEILPQQQSQTDVTLPIAKLMEVAAGVGLANMPASKDGKVRKVPLIIKHNDKIFPSLSLVVACAYLGCELSDIELNDKSINIKTAGRIIKIPTDRHGNMLINYAGDFKIFNRSSFYEIAAGYDRVKDDPNQDNKKLVDLKDKIILLGLTATGSTDLRPAPFSNMYPGVGIHANIINNILQNRFLYKPDWYVTAAILILLGLAVSVLIPKKRPAVSIGILLGIFFGYKFLVLILFIFANVWIDVVGPGFVILFSYMAVVFNQFTTERFQKQLIENELKIASDIQQSLLPKTLPSKAGIQIAVRSISAKHVGGDLYDFVDLGDSKVGIMIGDVSGKGVPAAIYMARTVGEFRSRASVYNQPSKMLSTLNDILSKESLSNMFVTLLYIIVDLSINKFVFSNGGHNAILYKAVDTDKIKTVDAKEGAPLGVIDGVVFSDEVVDFKSGDLVTLFTDGINEARNKLKSEFGNERLERFIIENKNEHAQQLADSLIENIKQFSKGTLQHDDMTLIIIKFL